MDKKELIQLLEQGWITKEALMVALGTIERNTRLILQELNAELEAEGRCVLSSASRRGYHIPSVNDRDDLETAKIAERELESKAISIFERRRAIRKYIGIAEAMTMKGAPVQGVLF